MYCPKCGTNNDLKAKFCINCGASLAKAKKEEGEIKPPKKSSNKSVIIALIIIFVLIFIIAAFLAWRFWLGGKIGDFFATPTPTISAEGNTISSHDFEPSESNEISVVRHIDLRQFPSSDHGVDYGIVAILTIKNISTDTKRDVFIIEKVPEVFSASLNDLDFSITPASKDEGNRKIKWKFDEIVSGDSKEISYQNAEGKRIIEEELAKNRFEQLKIDYTPAVFWSDYKVMLGAQYKMITDQVAADNNLPVNYGAWITQIDSSTPVILSDSPAALAGIVSGDIIIAVNGVNFGRMDLLRYLQQFDVGDVVILTIMHSDGTSGDVQVALQKWSD